MVNVCIKRLKSKFSKYPGFMDLFASFLKIVVKNSLTFIAHIIFRLIRSLRDEKLKAIVDFRILKKNLREQKKYHI